MPRKGPSAVGVRDVLEGDEVRDILRDNFFTSGEPLPESPRRQRATFSSDEQDSARDVTLVRSTKSSGKAPPKETSENKQEGKKYLPKLRNEFVRASKQVSSETPLDFSAQTLSEEGDVEAQDGSTEAIPRIHEEDDFVEHSSNLQRASKNKPDHYKVICISIYTQDLERLDEVVRELKRRGFTKANRSAVLRVAVEQLDLSRVPKGL